MTRKAVLDQEELKFLQDIADSVALYSLKPRHFEIQLCHDAQLITSPKNYGDVFYWQIGISADDDRIRALAGKSVGLTTIGSSLLYEDGFFDPNLKAIFRVYNDQVLHNIHIRVPNHQP